MKDKKVLLLIFLILFWLFFFVRQDKKPPLNTSKRIGNGGLRGKRDEKEEYILNYTKLERRENMSLSRDHNLFTTPRPKYKSPVKTVITEEELIMKELRSIDFLGIVSSGGVQKIYLEYQGEILEAGEKLLLQISTQNNSYDLSLSIEDDILRVSEPLYSLWRDINI